jgi:hypothetical protein
MRVVPNHFRLATGNRPSPAVYVRVAVSSKSLRLDDLEYFQLSSTLVGDDCTPLFAHTL